MRDEIFSNISKIIKRDSKVSTYKFALLRGTIDVILENSPFIVQKESRIYIPLGLLIEKWLLFYYPILASKSFIPQIHGQAKLAFEVQFKEMIVDYNDIGGFSVFYNDLRNRGIPQDQHENFFKLLKKLKATITSNPMKYIGRSFNTEYYSIFQYHPGLRIHKPKKIDLYYLLANFGEFSIPVEYYKAFQVLGSFIGGQDSILFKWAEFSVNASKNILPFEKVLTDVLKCPITEREIRESKKLYQTILKKDGKVHCVWTGTSIDTYDIDHLIPFSVWKNNDLWNLLPSSPKINNLKRNKIPSIDLIEKRKDLILYYWELIHKKLEDRFEREVKFTLIGDSSFENWQNPAIEKLKETCQYLITKRGFEEWNPKD